jgi:hypothetical protein
MFKPTFLYVKTHNKTGLKYFGKTTRDPFIYLGSGLHWKRHLKVHGCDVSTVIIGYFTDKKELIETALQFSYKNNIAESSEWANIIPENGIDGGSFSEYITDEIRKKMSENRKGKPSWLGRKHSMESRSKMSSSKKGIPSKRKGIPTGKPAHNKGKPAIVMSCLTCKKLVKGMLNFKRWHKH